MCAAGVNCTILYFSPLKFNNNSGQWLCRFQQKSNNSACCFFGGAKSYSLFREVRFKILYLKLLLSKLLLQCLLYLVVVQECSAVFGVHCTILCSSSSKCNNLVHNLRWSCCFKHESSRSVCYLFGSAKLYLIFHVVRVQGAQFYIWISCFPNAATCFQSRCRVRMLYGVQE